MTATHIPAMWIHGRTIFAVHDLSGEQVRLSYVDDAHSVPAGAVALQVVTHRELAFALAALKKVTKRADEACESSAELLEENERLRRDLASCEQAWNDAQAGATS